MMNSFFMNQSFSITNVCKIFGLPIKQARSYAEILDALLGDWEKSYEVVNAPLERKRRKLAKRNDE